MDRLFSSLHSLLSVIALDHTIPSQSASLCIARSLYSLLFDTLYLIIYQVMIVAIGMAARAYYGSCSSSLYHNWMHVSTLCYAIPKPVWAFLSLSSLSLSCHLSLCHSLSLYLYQTMIIAIWMASGWYRVSVHLFMTMTRQALQFIISNLFYCTPKHKIDYHETKKAL